MMDLSQVNRQLWIGNRIIDQHDVDEVVLSGISADIDLRGEDEGEHWIMKHNPRLDYLWNPTLDDGEHKPVEWFARAWDFAGPRFGTGAVILTHCHSGFHRSASMAVFLLMARWQLSLVKAVDMVVTQRAAADPIYADDAVVAIQELGLGPHPDPGPSKPDRSGMPYAR
jgi:hypothetical protein